MTEREKQFLKACYNITKEEMAKAKKDHAKHVKAHAGIKHDKSKPLVLRGFLKQFPRAIEEVARVSEFGANKYTWNGWETVPDGEQRYSEALARHLLRDGNDEESGYSHAAHAAWNAMVRLELMLRGK